MKLIDPIDIKQSIKDGQLEAFAARGKVYIKDVKSGDCVKILEEQPSAEPEIIYCKDCKKHNMQHNHFYHGKYIGVKECCPLIFVRGLAQGHEFDYQYCVYADRKEDE